MPQLDKITFVSQVIWLIIILILFYIAILYWILPQIGRILKIRKRMIDIFLYENNKFKNEALAVINPYKSTLLITSNISNEILDKFLKKKLLYFKNVLQVLNKNPQITNATNILEEELKVIIIKNLILSKIKK